MTTTIISEGAQSGNIVITSGNTVIVREGGTLSNTGIRGGGTIDDFGDATGLDISSGGTLRVESGGNAFFFGLNPNNADGATIIVSSGGAISNFTLNQGTRLTLSGGGEALSLDQTGSADIYGTLDASDILGQATVYSGGHITNPTISSFAQVTVSSGGSVDRATVDDATLIVGGTSATVTNATLQNGARLLVLSGGAAEADEASAASVTVMSGGTATVTSDGGDITVSAGGLVTALVLSNGTGNRLR